jgi:putative oxidoreductase
MEFKFRPLDLLRITVSLLLLIHGTARIFLWIVDDFGMFLSDVGFPLGIVIAWLVTIIEIGGSIFLSLNKFVKYLSIYFGFQLLMGVFLVHLQEGWFVVGAGRNGMEYSVLLILCLTAIFWDSIRTEK